MGLVSVDNKNSTLLFLLFVVHLLLQKRLSYSKENSSFYISPKGRCAYSLPVTQVWAKQSWKLRSTCLCAKRILLLSILDSCYA